MLQHFAEAITYGHLHVDPIQYISHGLRYCYYSLRFFTCKSSPLSAVVTRQPQFNGSALNARLPTQLVCPMPMYPNQSRDITLHQSSFVTYSLDIQMEIGCLPYSFLFQGNQSSEPSETRPAPSRCKPVSWRSHQTCFRIAVVGLIGLAPKADPFQNAESRLGNAPSFALTEQSFSPKEH